MGQDPRLLWMISVRIIPGVESIETLVTPGRRGGSRSTLAVDSGRARSVDGILGTHTPQ
jgi:hypothetical protein